MRKYHALLSFQAAALCVFAITVHAAPAWSPEQNVEVVAGTKPGGAADRTARTVQRLLQENKLIDVPATVLNKPGAGGAIAWSYINQHSGDGHYLSIATPPLLTNHITGKNTFHYTQLTPISLLFGEYFPFVVRADSPIKTGKDLIERIRKDPGSVSAGVASSGGANHMALGLVMKNAGIDVRKMKVVVFSSGGESLTALLGGHVDVVPTNPATIEPMLKSGKVRALGIAAEKRLGGTYATVPTWREQGVDAVLMTWRGIVAPKDLKQPQIAYWEGVFKRMTQSEEWRETLRKSHWGEHYLDSTGTRKFFDQQYEEFKAVLISLGLVK